MNSPRSLPTHATQEPCDGRILLPTPAVIETHHALVGVRGQRDTLGFREEQLESELKVLHIGTAAGIERIAAWKTVLRRGLDQDLLKMEEPELYAKYIRESSSRRFTLL